MNDNDRPKDNNRPDRPSRLVLSYNIQGIPDWIRTIARLLGRQREICVLGLPLTDRLNTVIEFLKNSKADIICLQECFGKKLQRHMTCALSNTYNCVFSNSRSGSSSGNSSVNSPFQQYMTPGLGVAYRTDRYQLVSECFVSCRCSTDKSLKTDGVQIVVLQQTGVGGVVNTTSRCAAGVTILNVHAPIFKNYTDIDTRMNQAYIDFVNNVIQFYVTTFNLVGGEIVVAGDFNSDSDCGGNSSANGVSDSSGIARGRGTTSWDPQHNLAGTDRYCHSYFNHKMSLDRILVNRPILSYISQRPMFGMNKLARQKWLQSCHSAGSSSESNDTLGTDCSDHFPILLSYQP